MSREQTYSLAGTVRAFAAVRKALALPAAVRKTLALPAAVLTALALPAAAFAHPGHGTTPPDSVSHYVFEPIHALPIVVLVTAIVVVYFLRRRKSSS